MTTAITALRKRLSRWELDHLRAHAAELADKLEAAQHRIEALEEEVNQAWRWSEHWRDQSQDLANELHEAGKAIGLTKDGELVVVEATAQGGAA
jgi:chromosome segregation ATPase